MLVLHIQDAGESTLCIRVEKNSGGQGREGSHSTRFFGSTDNDCVILLAGARKDNFYVNRLQGHFIKRVALLITGRIK